MKLLLHPGSADGSDTAKGRVPSALLGCHPLVYRNSAGQFQSRPDQSADWSARGRLRKQSPSLDGS